MFSHFVAWLTVFIQLVMNVPIEVHVSVSMKVTVSWYVMPYSPGVEITNVSEELAASNFSLASSYPQLELSLWPQDPITFMQLPLVDSWANSSFSFPYITELNFCKVYSFAMKREAASFFEVLVPVY